MKKFVMVCLLLLAGTMLLVQCDSGKSFKVKTNRAYIVKSTDGSGQVPVYTDTADEPVTYLPDGSAVRVTKSIEAGKRFWVNYRAATGDAHYLVKVENFAEEASGAAVDYKNHKLKAAENSGKITLYGQFGERLQGVDEGTVVEVRELTTNSSGAEGYNVRYKRKSYFVLSENIGEEAARSLAQRRMTGVNSMAFGLIHWALIIAAFIILLKLNKKTALKIYTKYYTQKRKEFPWLEEWFSKHADPIKPRAAVQAGAVLVVSIILFFALVLVFGFIQSRMMSSLSVLYYISSPIIIVIIFTICAKVAGGMIKKTNPATSDDQGFLTVECPSCHCPHAWGMVYELNTVTNINSETVKKTTETWDEDASGKRVFGSTKTRTKTEVYTVYTVEATRDLLCENCDYKKHTETTEFWGSKPKTEPQHFDPPKKAW